MDADSPLDQMASALIRVGCVVVVGDGPFGCRRFISALADEPQTIPESVAGTPAEGIAQETGQFGRRHRSAAGRCVRSAAVATAARVGRAGTAIAATRR